MIIGIKQVICNVRDIKSVSETPNNSEKEYLSIASTPSPIYRSFGGATCINTLYVMYVGNVYACMFLYINLS